MVVPSYGSVSRMASQSTHSNILFYKFPLLYGSLLFVQYLGILVLNKWLLLVLSFRVPSCKGRCFLFCA